MIKIIIKVNSKWQINKNIVESLQTRSLDSRMPWDKFTKGLITPIRSSDYCQTQILISRCKTLSYFHTAPRTWNTEVKRLDIETGLLHEWDEEAAQASVHVHWNAVAKSKLANFGDGIDDTVGKLGGRSH